MIGMTSVTFRKLNPEDIIEQCKKCGVQAIEWGADIHVPPGDFDNAEKVGNLTRKSGLQVSSYGSYFTVGKNKTEDFGKVLKTASVLGAPLVRIWCGEKSSPDTTENAFAVYVEQLKEMCSMSEKLGITIASEFHNGTYNDSSESALKLINSVNSEFYKTYWQMVEFNENDLLNLKAVIDYTAAAHIFAWNRYGRRYSLKRKRKLWENYIEILKSKNVNCILEFVKHDSVKQFEKDATVLSEMLK